MSSFREHEHYDSFEPETLALMKISFNEVWSELQRSGNSFDQTSTITAIAGLVIEFASQGETDPQRIKSLALAANIATVEICARNTPIIRGLNRRRRLGPDLADANQPLAVASTVPAWCCVSPR